MSNLGIEENHERMTIMAEEYRSRYNTFVTVNCLLNLKTIEDREASVRDLIPATERYSRQTVQKKLFEEQVHILLELSDDSELMGRKRIISQELNDRVELLRLYNLDYNKSNIISLMDTEQNVREIIEERRYIYMSSMYQKICLLRLMLITTGAGDSSEDVARFHIEQKESQFYMKIQQQIVIGYTDLALVEIFDNEEWHRHGWRGIGGIVTQERMEYRALMDILIPAKIFILQGDGGIDPNFEDGARLRIVKDERLERRQLWNQHQEVMTPVCLNDLFLGPQLVARRALDEVQNAERRHIYCLFFGCSLFFLESETESNARKSIALAARHDFTLYMYSWYLLHVEVKERILRRNKMHSFCFEHHYVRDRQIVSHKEVIDREQLYNYHRKCMKLLSERLTKVQRDARLYQDKMLLIMEEKYKQATLQQQVLDGHGLYPPRASNYSQTPSYPPVISVRNSPVAKVITNDASVPNEWDVSAAPHTISSRSPVAYGSNMVHASGGCGGSPYSSHLPDKESVMGSLSRYAANLPLFL